jgi:hypothetical protein
MPIAVPFASLVRLGCHLLASHVLRILVICAGFAVLLAVGLHSGRDFASALHAALTQGNGKAQSGAVSSRHSRAAPAMETIDPGSEFVTDRVGQLLFSRHNSDSCLRMLFDNRSGEMAEAGNAACGLITEAGDTALDRAELLRRAFRK